ncbi:MAG: hypothetical protein LCH61_12380 [Proteobacteria bacterium]|nr:hypothetical protein [Pseudomonadota bacterium]
MSNTASSSASVTTDPAHSPIAREFYEARRLSADAPKTIVIFDVETTGLSPAFDQIRQFAALRTEDLDDPQEGEDAINLTCRLRPEIVPSPQALLTTRVSPAEIEAPALSHAEMMGKIEDFLDASSPAVFAGHNVIWFDSPHIRHNLFSALLSPYPLQTPGCRLFDSLRLAHLVYCLRPDAVIWPKRQDGKPVFRLGELARGLGITFDETQAHDAQADVQATRDVLRVFRDRAPDLYALALALCDKGYVCDLLGRYPVVGQLGVYGGVSSVMPLTALTRDPANPNASLMVDLRIDPETYRSLPDADLASLMAGRTSPVRSMKHNAMPLLIPLKLTDPLAPEASMALHAHDPDGDPARADDLLQHRAALLKADNDFIERARAIRARQSADRVISPHVEEQLYCAFPGYADRALGRRFHDTSIEKRAALIPQFKDERLRVHATRLVHHDAPHTLDSETRRAMDHWLHHRLTTEDDVPWMTLPRALAETEDLRELLVRRLDAEACEAIADAPPILDTETGALLPDSEVIMEVEQLRLAYIEEHVGTSLKLLDDYADWLRNRCAEVTRI